MPLSISRVSHSTSQKQTRGSCSFILSITLNLQKQWFVATLSLAKTGGHWQELKGHP